MIVYAWKNEAGTHLSRPATRSELTAFEFDPQAACLRCGARLLSISISEPGVCPWCESNISRPKIAPYQEEQIIRLLEKQSAFNERLQAGRRPKLKNRSTERELRDYLTAHGYYGRSAEFLKLELTAIERPGWVQVFEFHTYAKAQDGGWNQLFGYVHSDERSKRFDVQLFHSESAMDASRVETRQHRLSLDRGPKHWSYWPLMAIAATVVTVAIAGALISANNDALPEAGPRKQMQMKPDVTQPDRSLIK